MDSEQAVKVLRREQEKARRTAAEVATAAREVEERAAAQAHAASWEAEYQTLLSRRPGLRAEIETIDHDLLRAVEVLRQAHAEAYSLLERRRQAEQKVTGLHQRLSRLAGWIGRNNWRADSIAVPASSVTWKVAAFIGRAWPED